MSRKVRGLHTQGDGALRARGLQILRAWETKAGKGPCPAATRGDGDAGSGEPDPQGAQLLGTAATRSAGSAAGLGLGQGIASSSRCCCTGDGRPCHSGPLTPELARPPAGP